MEILYQELTTGKSRFVRRTLTNTFAVSNNHFKKKYCSKICTCTAFSLNQDDLDGPVFCGYSPSVTGYRLAVAIITIIIGGLLFFKLWDNDDRMITWIILLINAIFWFGATIVDCSTLANSTLSCNDKGFNGGYYNCNNARYG